MGMSKCRACGASIKWVKTKTGKNMPCNAKVVWYVADANGSQNIVLITGDVVRGETAATPNEATSIGYISHFATCPRAKQFKRR